MHKFILLILISLAFADEFECARWRPGNKHGCKKVEGKEIAEWLVVGIEDIAKGLTLSNNACMAACINGCQSDEEYANQCCCIRTEEADGVSFCMAMAGATIDFDDSENGGLGATCNAEPEEVTEASDCPKRQDSIRDGVVDEMDFMRKCYAEECTYAPQMVDPKDAEVIQEAACLALSLICPSKLEGETEEEYEEVCKHESNADHCIWVPAHEDIPVGLCVVNPSMPDIEIDAEEEAYLADMMTQVQRDSNTNYMVIGLLTIAIVLGSLSTKIFSGKKEVSDTINRDFTLLEENQME